jgi:hypothetical protein
MQQCSCNRTALAATPLAEAPVLHVSGTGALLFVAGSTLGIALLWFVPTFYDQRRAYELRTTQHGKLLERLVEALSRKNDLSVEEVRQVVSAMNSPPRGLEGLTRGLLGLIITTFVGLAMAVTLISTSTDSSDLRKTIVTALLSILATVAGFYFGARTAQSAAEQATRPPTPLAQPGHGDGPDGDHHDDNTQGKNTAEQLEEKAADTPGAAPGKTLDDRG